MGVAAWRRSRVGAVMEAKMVGLTAVYHGTPGIERVWSTSQGGGVFECVRQAFGRGWFQFRRYGHRNQEQLHIDRRRSCESN